MTLSRLWLYEKHEPELGLDDDGSGVDRYSRDGLALYSNDSLSSVPRVGCLSIRHVLLAVNNVGRSKISAISFSSMQAHTKHNLTCSFSEC